jgi:hypothetical protein
MRFAVVMALLQAMSWVPPAHAAGSQHGVNSGVEKIAARAEWRQGNVAYNLGHYDEAAKHYEVAYTLVQDPAFLFNIAQSYRMGGKLDQAGAVQRSQLCSGGLQRTGGSVVSCSNRGKKGDNRPEHGPVLSGREVFGDGSRPVAAPMAP